MKARVGLGYGMAWPGQYRDGRRVGPESELNEIKIIVQDDPRRFNDKSNAG